MFQKIDNTDSTNEAENQKKKNKHIRYTKKKNIKKNRPSSYNNFEGRTKKITTH